MGTSQSIGCKRKQEWHDRRQRQLPHRFRSRNKKHHGLRLERGTYRRVRERWMVYFLVGGRLVGKEEEMLVIFTGFLHLCCDGESYIVLPLYFR